MISFKPYIFVALLPGTLIWVSFKRIQSINNPVFRILIAPLIITIFLVGGSFIFGSLSSNLNQYSSVEGVLNKAATNQQDLKQEYYHGNSFDIGKFDF
jgi:uncharacterized BrkB/YihY/UPF0761 family membrane protein